jgi:hypothetical protein
LETHDVQLQYWNQFPRLKRDAIYINRYHGDLERIDLALEMVSAVTSSAAIGGWAIWHAAAFLWGAVIAASQVRLASRRRVNLEGSVWSRGEAPAACDLRDQIEA